MFRDLTDAMQDYVKEIYKLRLEGKRATTSAIAERLGVRPPCLLTGHEAIPVAYYTGCHSGSMGGHNGNITRAEILDTARRLPVGALTAPGRTPPDHARDWKLHRLDGMDVRIAPAPLAGGTA